MTEEPRRNEKADIEGILSDLDSILSGAAPVQGSGPPAAEKRPPSAPPEEPTVPPELAAALQVPLNPAAAAPPAEPARLEPPPGAEPAAGPAPRVEPPPAAPNQPEPPRAVFPAAGEPASAAPAKPGKLEPPPGLPEFQADQGGPPEDLKIELAPRAGLPPAVPENRAQTANPKSVPAQAASAYRPPMELKLGPTAPPAPAEAAREPPAAALEPPPAASEASPAEAKPAPAAAEPPPAGAAAETFSAAAVPGATAAPGAAPLVLSTIPVEDSVPPNTAKDQIRKIAILFFSGQRGKYDEFVKFLDTMALHFTKKPLFLRKCLVAELAGDEDAHALVEKVKASGAAGVVGLLGGATEAKLRALEDPLSAAGLFFRWIPVEDVKKRMTAVDLLVDLTLLSPG